MSDTKLKFYYFDPNKRVYEMNGVKKDSPYYEGYFIPIDVVSENEKEFICKYGVINKKTMEYYLGRTKHRVYTEQQKIDKVYVAENSYKIAGMVRGLPAYKLRQVEALLDGYITLTLKN